MSVRELGTMEATRQGLRKNRFRKSALIQAMAGENSRGLYRLNHAWQAF